MSELVILGLLKIKPMHGYEIQTIIQESKIDDWANLLSGSIYYSISKLEKEQLIEPFKEERTGSRVRVIYKITKAGEEKHLELIKQNLGEKPHSLKSDFMLALSMMRHLDQDEALSILNENLNDLKKLREQWEIRKQAASESKGSDPLMLLSFKSSLEILDIDIKTVERAIALI
ncbi:PadR family transcriptional regulator [Lysinibacillus yapensis]|uniref:PadR family transcriptional regulator n=1 Tax=Ureibacillus yapensis TaxID=2304605 RepID=A0A396S6L9_9BACL|nr:PadR family transcriptional regulator [Lysinibacillus yapensis]RHW32067.1 PadR family transcriptional regulator [Lysinibacillus yapensis]